MFSNLIEEDEGGIFFMRWKQFWKKTSKVDRLWGRRTRAQGDGG